MVHNSRSSSNISNSSNSSNSNNMKLNKNIIMPQKHLLRLLQLHQIAAATVIFILLSTCICVSGQIDGYEAGVDYPIYDAVPKGLSFNCQGRLPGYYADTETRCQQIDGYEAGVDYPIYDAVPKGLSFNCQGRLPGYYADTETRCQVWHWCLHSGHQYSFLCPNGTVFNQAVRVCDWWSNVNCPAAEQLYENNDELYRTTEANQYANDDNSI